MNKALSALLLALPLTYLADSLTWSPIVVMTFACIGMIPLAWWMGKATEHISHQVGPTAGGLINATFGNACELIIAIFALKAGLVEVVKASIIGSIIGNILLVMGASMVFGGLKTEVQKFNKDAAITLTVSLTIMAFGLIMPAVLHHTSPKIAPGVDIKVALAISAVLMAYYFLGLLFNLGTHRHLFLPVSSSSEDKPDGHPWSVKKSILVLLLTTLGFVFLSQHLVANVEAAALSMGMTPVFVGVILLALIGNAAENTTAIQAALQNKMDLSLNIALGSSTQIAMFVTPLIVLAGIVLGQPMDLVFTPGETLAVIPAVLVSTLAVQDGKSNWYEGAGLITIYLIAAICFYFFS